MALDVAVELSSLAKKSNTWSAILDEAVRHGYPVGGLLEKAEALHEEALRLAALFNGEKLYAVELRYEGVRREDEEEALYAAFAGDGNLVDKRIEVAEDPSATLGDLTPQASPAPEEQA